MTSVKLHLLLTPLERDALLSIFNRLTDQDKRPGDMPRKSAIKKMRLALERSRTDREKLMEPNQSSV